MPYCIVYRTLTAIHTTQNEVHKVYQSTGWEEGKRSEWNADAPFLDSTHGPRLDHYNPLTYIFIIVKAELAKHPIMFLGLYLKPSRDTDKVESETDQPTWQLTRVGAKNLRQILLYLKFHVHIQFHHPHMTPIVIRKRSMVTKDHSCKLSGLIQ